MPRKTVFEDFFPDKSEFLKLSGYADVNIYSELFTPNIALLNFLGQLKV